MLPQCLPVGDLTGSILSSSWHLPQVAEHVGYCQPRINKPRLYIWGGTISIANYYCLGEPPQFINQGLLIWGGHYRFTKNHQRPWSSRFLVTKAGSHVDITGKSPKFMGKHPFPLGHGFAIRRSQVGMSVWFDWWMARRPRSPSALRSSQGRSDLDPIDGLVRQGNVPYVRPYKLWWSSQLKLGPKIYGRYLLYIASTQWPLFLPHEKKHGKMLSIMRIWRLGVPCLEEYLIVV